MIMTADHAGSQWSVTRAQYMVPPGGFLLCPARCGTCLWRTTLYLFLSFCLVQNYGKITVDATEHDLESHWGVPSMVSFGRSSPTIYFPFRLRSKLRFRRVKVAGEDLPLFRDSKAEVETSGARCKQDLGSCAILARTAFPLQRWRADDHRSAVSPNITELWTPSPPSWIIVFFPEYFENHPSQELTIPFLEGQSERPSKHAVQLMRASPTPFCSTVTSLVPTRCLSSLQAVHVVHGLVHLELDIRPHELFAALYWLMSDKWIPDGRNYPHVVPLLVQDGSLRCRLELESPSLSIEDYCSSFNRPIVLSASAGTSMYLHLSVYSVLDDVITLQDEVVSEQEPDGYFVVVHETSSQQSSETLSNRVTIIGTNTGAKGSIKKGHSKRLSASDSNLPAAATSMLTLQLHSASQRTPATLQFVLVTTPGGLTSNKPVTYPLVRHCRILGRPYTTVVGWVLLDNESTDAVVYRLRWESQSGPFSFSYTAFGVSHSTHEMIVTLDPEVFSYPIPILFHPVAEGLQNDNLIVQHASSNEEVQRFSWDGITPMFTGRSILEEATDHSFISLNSKLVGNTSMLVVAAVKALSKPMAKELDATMWEGQTLALVDLGEIFNVQELPPRVVETSLILSGVTGTKKEHACHALVDVGGMQLERHLPPLDPFLTPCYSDAVVGAVSKTELISVTSLDVTDDVTVNLVLSLGAWLPTQPHILSLRASLDLRCMLAADPETRSPSHRLFRHMFCNSPRRTDAVISGIGTLVVRIPMSHILLSDDYERARIQVKGIVRTDHGAVMIRWELNFTESFFDAIQEQILASQDIQWETEDDQELMSEIADEHSDSVTTRAVRGQTFLGKCHTFFVLLLYGAILWFVVHLFYLSRRPSSPCIGVRPQLLGRHATRHHPYAALHASSCSRRLLGFALPLAASNRVCNQLRRAACQVREAGRAVVARAKPHVQTAYRRSAHAWTHWWSVMWNSGARIFQKGVRISQTLPSVMTSPSLPTAATTTALKTASTRKFVPLLRKSERLRTLRVTSAYHSAPTASRRVSDVKKASHMRRNPPLRESQSPERTASPDVRDDEWSRVEASKKRKKNSRAKGGGRSVMPAEETPASVVSTEAETPKVPRPTFQTNNAHGHTTLRPMSDPAWGESVSTANPWNVLTAGTFSCAKEQDCLLSGSKEILGSAAPLDAPEKKSYSAVEAVRQEHHSFHHHASSLAMEESTGPLDGMQEKLDGAIPSTCFPAAPSEVETSKKAYQFYDPPAIPPPSPPHLFNRPVLPRYRSVPPCELPTPPGLRRPADARDALSRRDDTRDTHAADPLPELLLSLPLSPLDGSTPSAGLTDSTRSTADVPLVHRDDTLRRNRWGFTTAPNTPRSRVVSPYSQFSTSPPLMDSFTSFARQVDRAFDEDPLLSAAAVSYLLGHPYLHNHHSLW